MKSFFVVTLIAVSLPLVSQAAENKSADAQAVDSACAAEAATAGCSNEKVGSGLLKCLGAYRRAHKTDAAKPSAGCKAALQKLRADHKEK